MAFNNFDPPENTEKHECRSYQEGDWIIFWCPECPDYQRKINRQTGEMVSGKAQNHISHSGMYYSKEYENILVNVN